jgi:hypothetical protein
MGIYVRIILVKELASFQGSALATAPCRYATPDDANIGKIWVPLEVLDQPSNMLLLSVIPLHKTGDDYFADMDNSAPTTVKWISQRYSNYHYVDVDIALRNGVGPTNNAAGVCFGFQLLSSDEDLVENWDIFTVDDNYSDPFGKGYFTLAAKKFYH